MNEKTIANNTTTEKDINKTVVNNAIENNNNNNIPVNKPRYNVQNLKPYNKTDRILSKEEAKRRGSLGGKKSGENRKARKTMRETILEMLAMELTPEKLEEMGIDTSTLNGDYTMQSAVISAMFREATNGDTKAMQLLRDTIGEAPVSRQEIQQEIITKEDTDMMKDLRDSLISKVM